MTLMRTNLYVRNAVPADALASPLLALTPLESGDWTAAATRATATGIDTVGVSRLDSCSCNSGDCRRCPRQEWWGADRAGTEDGSPRPASIVRAWPQPEAGSCTGENRGMKGLRLCLLGGALLAAAVAG
eukprot:CAMPEP_0185541112 /NCGR_PEP_ID=MMETSP1381-20130426/1753_1 /TAXON_ID=298111 /ORGANISM="Pavlova sp., Strain CCMP459" /LENGTH=128 /DNA_ID=CAMNT_0028153011 /DNA_START=13 /DNA_END=399 /DNA_ORIENTATION=+